MRNADLLDVPRLSRRMNPVGEFDMGMTEQSQGYMNEQERSIQAVDQLDLFPIKSKLCLPEDKGGKDWTWERADAAEVQYRRFLKLAIWERGKEISPLGDIDEMWHTHILFTKKYHADCNQIFGRYMHHMPLFTEEQKARVSNGRAKTRELFKRYFGECTELLNSCACGNSGGNCCGNDS